MLTNLRCSDFNRCAFAYLFSSYWLFTASKRLASGLAAIFTILMLACVPAVAQDPNANVKIEIARAYPDTNNIFSITVSGSWRDACIPQNPAIERFGQSIYVRTSNSGQCPLAPTPFSFTTTVGPLPPGNYQMFALYSSPRRFTELIGTTSLTVSFGVEVIPSDPGTSDDISLKISGVWPDSCVPRDAKVTVSGESIRIDTSNPSQGCLDVITPYSLTVFVGKLSAGEHAVLVTYSGASYPAPITVGRSNFTVRPHEAQVQVYPPSPSSRDNLSLRIVGEGSACSPHDPKVTISSGSIRIDSTYFAGPCILLFVHWALEVPIGKLDAGPYQVVATKSPEGGGPQQIIARTNFSVNSPATRDVYFSHFATGGGISSSILLTNPSQTETATGSVSFVVFDQKGSVPISVNGAPPALSVSFTIKPLSTVTLNTDGSGSLISGWVHVSSDIPIGGVLKLSVPALGVAQISAVSAMRGWVIPVRASVARNLTTAIAVAALDPSPQKLVFTLRDRNGDIVSGGQTSYISSTLSRHLAQFLQEIFPEADLREFEGTLTVTAATGTIAATAIEIGGNPAVLTTLPVNGLR